MNHLSTVTTVLLVIMLAALSGCDSKKEKAAPQQPQQAGQAQAPRQAGAPTAAPAQDETDAAPLKGRVLAQIKAGEYAAIYTEASAGFREVGPEQQFEALWVRQQQETGGFKDAREVSHTVRPEDKFLVYIYHVQYEKKNKQIRLTFGRSKRGKMELTGVNQTDIK